MIALTTFFVKCLVLIPAAASLSGMQTPGAEAAGVEFFEKKVRPLLVEHCYACHSSARQKSGLRLDRKSFILQGGDRGPVLVPGDPDKSRLIQAVRYMDENLRMPPKSKLKNEQIADLTAWVTMGAPAPPDASTSDAAPVVEFDLARRRSEHWAWQPVRAQPLPTVKDPNGSLHAIDRFIIARLEEAALHPAAPADKRTLMRRAYFDLIGLPPTAQEVEAFLADESPEAFEKVVDRLLASEHFGERWARHWLDLVRYAETRGHEFDHSIANAYQYRDYVIRAFNADVPYDQFVREHIAGDLMEPPRLNRKDQFNESVLGTGFWFLGEEVHSPVDIRGDETERVDNKIDVFSKAFLGLTVSCARCHDHKFDAIAQQDYYALAGFLISSSYRQVPFESMEQNRHVARELESLRREWRPAIAPAVAGALTPSVSQLAEYLLAARGVIATDSPHTPQGRDAGGSFEEVAARFDLDPARLARWVEHLRKSREDRDDPFWLWLSLTVDGPATDAQRIQAATEPMLRGLRKGLDQFDAWLKSARVIVDYREPAANDWFVDGSGFGARPDRPGELRFSSDPARPIAEVIHRAAARTDPVWNEFQLAPGTEVDPGKATWSQAGRMLRTRTITMKTGRLFYLARGPGTAYAAVDSHHLIAGPLHGALVQSWDDSGDKPRWIEHDLSAYQGHRVHVEFRPQPPDANKPAAAALSIMMVVEADTPPAELPAATAKFFETLPASALESAEKLAQFYESQFLAAVDSLHSDAAGRPRDVETRSWLANWVLQHPTLFDAKPDDSRNIAEVVRPFMEQHAALVSQIRRVSHTAPALLDGNGVDEVVLLRGNHRTPGAVAPRRMLQAIAGSDTSPQRIGSGRLDLALAVTDPSNPLLARVLVNRVWHHCFGRGIVATVDDFGALGERPTHPELLDYLARRFIERGWSIKALIREIMLSSAYQMSSRSDPQAAAADPRNLLLHHKPVRRLDAESIRDAILTVSGRLDRTMFGPSVEVYLTPFLEGRGRPGASGPLDGNGRRSIYLRVRRNFPHPMLTAFDLPTPFSTIGRRSVSNVPAQALALMNSPFVIEQANLWAQRLRAGANESDAARVVELYLTAFSRPPTAEELDAALNFLNDQQMRNPGRPQDERPWVDLCHVLLNVKEFIFVQ